VSDSPLSQSQIDALLASLASSRAAATPSGLASSWAIAGEALANALADLLTRAWRRFVPDVVVTRSSEVSATPVARVVRLGAPLSMRWWFLWDVDRNEVYEAVVNELAALVPAPLSHQWLTTPIPVPEQALILPYRGQAPGRTMQLTIAFETSRLPAVRQVLLEPATGQEAASAAPGAAMDVRPEVGQIEVDIAVYVGGGVYSLQELASLRPGSILTLATEVGEPAILAIQERIVGRGQVVVNPDGTLGVRLTALYLDREPDDRPSWLPRPSHSRG